VRFSCVCFSRSGPRVPAGTRPSLRPLGQEGEATKQSSGGISREDAKLRGSPSRMPNYSRNQEDEDRENDNLHGMRTIGRRRRFPDFTSNAEQEPARSRTAGPRHRQAGSGQAAKF
jgi:hypothetical protein